MEKSKKHIDTIAKAAFGIFEDPLVEKIIVDVEGGLLKVHIIFKDIISKGGNNE